jgi:ceramide glucosyltransferase
MTLAIAALSLWTGLLILVLFASAATAVLHFGARPHPAHGRVLPMTLIKPIRGLDDAMQRSFDSILAADAARALQVIVSIETAEDPAYAVARRWAQDNPDRDILVLLAGPHGGRMGKIHNMIAALPRAKHGFVVFSDADSCVTAELLAETSKAFEDGCDSAFAMPYHPPSPGLAGFLFQIAFNHTFAPLATMTYYAGRLRFASGAWMGYTKEVLARAGGLERFEHAIADDLAISRAVSEVGASRRLLREPVIVQETTVGAEDAFRHLVKWSAIVRASLPSLYVAAPLFLPGVCAAALWALRAPHGGALLAVALAARAGSSLVIDGFAGRRLMPLPLYVPLAFVDLGTLVFWVAGFRRTIRWRGTKYRLAWGGEARVVGS